MEVSRSTAFVVVAGLTVFQAFLIIVIRVVFLQNSLNVTFEKNVTLSPREGRVQFLAMDMRRNSSSSSQLGDLPLNSLHQLSTEIPSVGLRNSSSHNGSSGESRSVGAVVREGGKILLSSVPGKVRLPVVTSTAEGRKALRACPQMSPKLVGERPAITMPRKASDLEKRFPFLSAGGDYRPPDCEPGQRVAIIIPYRDRWGHLHVLLYNLVPLLVRQQASFTIFVIEQEPPSTFNRALMLNVGVLEAALRDRYSCFIFHDVDLVPLNDHSLYRCRDQPKHLSVGVDKFGYRLPYNQIFGGVSALSREQIERVNGNSNLFFGWGGEDDDLWKRVTARGMKVVRDPPQIARYNMIRHTKDATNRPNPARMALLKTSVARMDVDGLVTLVYNVTSAERKPLYTWIKVKVDPQPFLLSSSSYVPLALRNYLSH